MELNESPVFLLFHTQQSIVRKDLPVSLYESGNLALLMLLPINSTPCMCTRQWMANANSSDITMCKVCNVRGLTLHFPQLRVSTQVLF